MKNTLLTIGLAGMATALLSSFAFTQKSDQTQEPKKNRHVRIVKIENGKKMEIDTVFATDDVFVWNGDTINPVKHIRKFNPGNVDIVKHIGRKDKNGNVMFLKHSGKAGEPMIWNMDTDENMEIVTEDNDSTGKKIVIHKMIKDGNGNHLMYLNEPGMKHFPPMPPMPPAPPVPHVKMMGIKHAGKIIDLNDPNIISYKKKDMSGDREKIEIIRKKSAGNEDEAFNFRFDDELMAPEAPEAPDFRWESADDSIHVKIIEKKEIIKDKDGKEIDVKVKREENK